MRKLGFPTQDPTNPYPLGWLRKDAKLVIKE
jgi:hypothetical protein